MGEEVGALVEPDYQAYVHFGTLFSAVAMTLLTLWRVAILRARLKKILTVTPTFDTSKRLGNTCLRWVFATIALPGSIYLIGTFAINNFGGLGGLL